MTAAPVPLEVDDLLRRLGLPPGAPSEDVEAAHAAVVAFLAQAPGPIRGWAHEQAAAADDALLRLTDPAAAARPTLSGRQRPAATRPSGPAAPPDRWATPSPVPTPAPSPIAEEIAGALDEPVDELALLAAVTPSMHRDEVPAARPAAVVTGTARLAARPAPPRRAPGLVRNLAVLAIAGGVLGIGAMAVYGMDGSAAPAATQPPAAAAPSAPVLDQAVVADLMTKIQANPKDTATLLALADEFYAAGQWDNAKTWLDKLLAIEPDSIRGLLAAGATSFNLGDFEDAEQRWQRVVEIDEKNLEAHYDLGFLYLNREPADLQAVAREWGRVQEIDPDSELAKTVSTHLAALLPSAAPSAGASAAPSGALGSAAPSSVPSAAPTPVPSTATPSVAPSAAPSAEPAP